MIDISIVPIYEGKKISRLQIVNISIIPFETLKATVYLINEDGKFVRQDEYTMTLDEYNNWLDDEYLIDWVLQKSGFEKLPQPETN